MPFTFTTAAKSKPAFFAASVPLPNTSAILAESRPLPGLEAEIQELTPQNNIVSTTVEEAPDRVVINGQQYELTFNETLEPGQYSLAQRDSIADDFTVLIAPKTDNPRYRVQFQNEPSLNAIKTTRVKLNIPDFLLKWNARGSIDVTRSLEQHPRATATFSLNRAQECQARITLKRGKLVNLFGISFRITDYSYTPLQEEAKQILLTITLSGEHESYANLSRSKWDLPIYLKGENGEKFGWQSLSDYAKEVGAKYTGKPIYIYVSKSTSTEATTTLRELLNRAIVNEQFVFYSAPNRIEARDWGKTKLHKLKDHYTIESHAFPGAGTLIGKVQLLREFRNTELILQKPEDINDEIVETQRWEFEGCKSLADMQTPAVPISVGDKISIYKNPSLDALRDPTTCFDTGNFSKKAHLIAETNGVETSRETWEWGWIHNSLDCYTVIPKDAVVNGSQDYGTITKSENYRVIFTPLKKFSFIANAWKEVRRFKTVRHFNSEGYLVEEKVAGKELARSLQDTSDLEAIGTQLRAFELLKKSDDSEDADQAAELLKQAEALFKLADCYRFLKTEPIKSKTSYELEPHSKYFSDINNPASKDNFIEPRFVKHSLKTDLKRVVEENPGSTEEIPLPPIVRGCEETQEQRTVVTSKKDPGRFVTMNFAARSDGRGLADKISIGDPKENIGRPSIHQRKPVPKPTKPKEVSTGNGFTAQSLDEAIAKEVKILLNTPNSDPIGNLSQDSISFPDVFDKKLALKAAQTLLSKENLGAENLVVNSAIYRDYEEGDRLLLEGEQKKIRQINFSFDIEGVCSVKCSKYQITLGYLTPNPAAKITVTEVKTNADSPLAQSPISGLQSIDGNASQLKSIFNYFSPTTIANAIRMDMLDELMQETGTKVLGQQGIQEEDSMESFLSSSLGSSSANFSSTGVMTTNRPEDGFYLDERVPSKIEQLADLLNRIALIDKTNAKIDELLKELMKELKPEALSGLKESSEESSSGGGGEDPPPGGSLIGVSPRPNMIFKGVDPALEKVLQSLFGTLADLIESLELGSEEAGGGAGGSGGGSAGGSGGGSDGGKSDEPVLQIGNLTIIADSTDFEGFFALLQEMLAYILSLIANFDSSLEEMLNNLLGKMGLVPASTTGGSGGGAGGAATPAAQQSITTNYIFPEGYDVATITYLFPEEEFDLASLLELLDQIDLMLVALDELANEEFDFDLDLSVLDPGAGVAQPVSASGQSPTGASGGSGGNSQTIGSGNQTFPGDPLVIDKYVEIEDISGVLGGGIKPLPKWPGGSSSGTGSYNSSSSGSSGSASSGLLGSSIPPASSATGTLSQGSGLSGNTSNNSGSTSTGTTGGFNSGGSNSASLGSSHPFAATNIALTLSTPSSSGFELPTTSVDESIDPVGQFVIAPNTVSHNPDFQGEIIVINAIASEQVVWSILSHSKGVNLLTPYDLDLSIELDNTFDNNLVFLRVSLRKAPEVYADVTLDPSFSSVFSTSRFRSVNTAKLPETAKVDSTSLIPVAEFNEDGSFSYTFSLPEITATHPVESYELEKLNELGEWVEVSSSTEPKVKIEIGESYRIVASYFCDRVPSDIFVITNPPLLGLSSFEAGRFRSVNNAKALTAEPIENFYFAKQAIATEDSFETGKFRSVNNAKDLTSQPIDNFYALLTDVAEESKVEAGKFRSVNNAKALVETEVTPFYSV